MGGHSGNLKFLKPQVVDEMRTIFWGSLWGTFLSSRLFYLSLPHF